MEVAGCFNQRPSEKPFSLLANQGTLQVAPEHSYSLPAEAMHSSGHSDAQSSLHWWMPWRKRCFKDEEYPPMQTIQLKRTHQKTSFWKKFPKLKLLKLCLVALSLDMTVFMVLLVLAVLLVACDLPVPFVFIVPAERRDLQERFPRKAAGPDLPETWTHRQSHGKHRLLRCNWWVNFWILLGWYVETWNCGGTQQCHCIFLKTGSFCDFLFCPDIVPNNHKTGNRIPFRCQPVYLQKEHSKNVWAELQPAISLIFVGHFTNFTLFPWILPTLFQLSHHGLAAIGKVCHAWGQLPSSGTNAAMTAAIGARGATGV